MLVLLARHRPVPVVLLKQCVSHQRHPNKRNLLLLTSTSWHLNPEITVCNYCLTSTSMRVRGIASPASALPSPTQQAIREILSSLAQTPSVWHSNGTGLSSCFMILGEQREESAWEIWLYGVFYSSISALESLLRIHY